MSPVTLHAHGASACGDNRASSRIHRKPTLSQILRRLQQRTFAVSSVEETLCTAAEEVPFSLGVAAWEGEVFRNVVRRTEFSSAVPNKTPRTSNYTRLLRKIPRAGMARSDRLFSRGRGIYLQTA